MRKNILTSKATDANVEKEIKEWLKFASVRLKEQEKRDRERLQKANLRRH